MTLSNLPELAGALPDAGIRYTLTARDRMRINAICATS